MLIPLAVAFEFSLGVLLVLFLSVLLHELGHSLMARRLGIRVMDITFWPLGGMARLHAMPEVPSVEAQVAIAGPLVNLCLAGMGAALWVFSAPVAGPTVGFLLLALVVMNLLLGLSNLLPAFPMDGGRLLRSWFARKHDWVTATEKAVQVGRWVALVLALLSLTLVFFSPQSLCVVFLFTLFIWVSGGWELMAVRVRHGRSPFAPGAMGTAYAEATAPATPAPETEPGPTGARRPRAWKPGPTRRGFSEDDIRALENYRGSLRRPPDEDGPNSLRNT